MVGYLVSATSMMAENDKLYSIRLVKINTLPTLHLLSIQLQLLSQELKLVPVHSSLVAVALGPRHTGPSFHFSMLSVSSCSSSLLMHSFLSSNKLKFPLP